MDNEVEEVRAERILQAELANKDSDEKCEGLVGKESSGDRKSSGSNRHAGVCQIQRDIESTGTENERNEANPGGLA